MKLLPIGSVISIKNIKMIIIGYNITPVSKIRIDYIVALYPLGITDEKSIALISVERNFKIISEGYKSKEFSCFINEKNSQFTTLKDVDVEQLRNFLNKIEEVIK